MATYAGPQVGPVFVTGVINDAWAAALDRTNAARGAIAGLKPPTINGNAPDEITVHLQLSPQLAPAGQVRSGPADAITGELSALLASFISAHYPPIAMPDPAAAFEGVLQQFGDRDMELAARRVTDRASMVWSVRGITIPAAAADYQARELGRRADKVRALQQVNVDVVRQSNLKELALAGWELAMRTQTEALDAARAFLIGAVASVQEKVAQDQAGLTRLKEQAAGAFFRVLGAQVEAGSITVDQLALRERIQVDSKLAGEDRKAFVFKEKVQAALAELESLASQASAAINRVSASAGVGGNERTP